MSTPLKSLQKVFEEKKESLLSIFFTAGFPKKDSTTEICLALNEAGVDFIEVGFPFSDPIADGLTIQQSSEKAIKNGMNLSVLFSQLKEIKPKLSLPVLLMGYLNPVMQFGMERFLDECVESGVSALILPDLPLIEYKNVWSKELSKRGLGLVFLVTPQTTEERIREIDELSTSFIYAVSSQAVTGAAGNQDIQSSQDAYFKRLKDLNLNSPVIVGFGIHDKKSFERASLSTRGAIIGSAFLRAIENAENVKKATLDFVRGIR